MRFLIIDTQKEIQSGCQAAIKLLQRNGILSEEETLSKFKEVFNAGINIGSKGINGRYDELWDNFNKTL